MMETSRERVLKAINHIQPEVTPVHIMGFEGAERWLRHFQAKDVFELRGKLGLDIRMAPPIYTGQNASCGLSIWGTKRNVIGYQGVGYSREKGDHPLIGAESVADIERFNWPEADEFEFDAMRELLLTVPDIACWVGPRAGVVEKGLSHKDITGVPGAWIPFVCTLFELFGFEETLMKFYDQPKLIEAATYHFEEFILNLSQRVLKATEGLADIFWFGDDFATARGMMMSPEHWRKFLKPTYRKIFQLAKSHDRKMWFHCCGTFREVMPDLIDMGMDVWETTQVHLPGNEPEVLKKEYGKDICFYGAINTQQTLPFGTPDEVRAEVRERIRLLGKGGGYIVGGDHAILPDVPIENVLAMIDEAKNTSP